MCVLLILFFIAMIKDWDDDNVFWNKFVLPIYTSFYIMLRISFIPIFWKTFKVV